jgi:hypothetical protein
MAELLIREVWPSVSASPNAATMGRTLQKSIFFAPFGWLAIAPVFAKRLMGWLPGLGGMSQRYRLTNRRLLVCSGFPPKPVREVALDQIKDVRIVPDENSQFYVAANIDIIGHSGQVILSLAGVPEPESFKHSVLDAAASWGPLLNPV